MSLDYSITTNFIKKTETNDIFYKKFGKFMIGEIVINSKKSFDNIILDQRILPIIDENSKTYYFLDENNISYAVMTIIGQDGNPIEYKTVKLDDKKNSQV